MSNHDRKYITSDGEHVATMTFDFTANRTITFPDSSSPIADTTSVQVLTNKTLLDISNDIAANKLRGSSSDITIDGSQPGGAGYFLLSSSTTAAVWTLDNRVITTGVVAAGDIPIFIDSDSISASGVTFTLGILRTPDLQVTSFSTVGIVHNNSSGDLTTSLIVNADIAAAAAIVDTKLATISTAGKVSNSATTATSLNTIDAIVTRDGSGNFTAGTITAALTGNATTATTAISFSGALIGDVTGTQGATVVGLVGGATAANVATATALAIAATSANTINTIVKRDGSGNFSAGTITASLTGSATSFTGSLVGDVIGTQGATAVALVGGQTAADVATATILANAATDVNTLGTIVKRDGSGNFSAGTITATLSGNATTATTAVSFSGPLVGDVTGTQGVTVVSLVGGSTGTAVGTATVLANAATSANTFSTIVKRDGSGNFTATTITAALSGNATTATTATSFSGPLVGDVTGTQGATIVATIGGSTAANVNAATVLANAATDLNTLSTIVKRDGSGNFTAGTITSTAEITSSVSISAVTATSVLTVTTTGESNPRIATRTDGYITMGSGSAVFDVALGRSAAGAMSLYNASLTNTGTSFSAATLMTDSITTLNGGTTISFNTKNFSNVAGILYSTAVTCVSTSVSGSPAWRTRLTTDSALFTRLNISNIGDMLWGPGDIPGDCRLRRSGAGNMWFDDGASGNVTLSVIGTVKANTISTVSGTDIAFSSKNFTGVGTLNARTIANWADGPASSTANAVAKYSGTGGKTLLDSGVIIDGSNNVSGVVGLTSTSVSTSSISSTGDLTITPASSSKVTFDCRSSVIVQAYVNDATPAIVMQFGEIGTIATYPMCTIGSNGGIMWGTTVAATDVGLGRAAAKTLNVFNASFTTLDTSINVGTVNVQGITTQSGNDITLNSKNLTSVGNVTATAIISPVISNTGTMILNPGTTHNIGVALQGTTGCFRLYGADSVPKVLLKMGELSTVDTFPIFAMGSDGITQYGTNALAADTYWYRTGVRTMSITNTSFSTSNTTLNVGTVGTATVTSAGALALTSATTMTMTSTGAFALNGSSTVIITPGTTHSVGVSLGGTTGCFKLYGADAVPKVLLKMGEAGTVDTLPVFAMGSDGITQYGTPALAADTYWYRTGVKTMSITATDFSAATTTLNVGTLKANTLNTISGTNIAFSSNSLSAVLYVNSSSVTNTGTSTYAAGCSTGNSMTTNANEAVIFASLSATMSSTTAAVHNRNAAISCDTVDMSHVGGGNYRNNTAIGCISGVFTSGTGSSGNMIANVLTGGSGGANTITRVNGTGTTTNNFVSGFSNTIGVTADVTTDACAIFGSANSIARGSRITAIGNQITVTGAITDSIALGTKITLTTTGSLACGDSNTSTALTTATNRFDCRFSAGYRFASNAASSAGVTVAASGTAWASISDISTKENIVDTQYDDIYERIRRIDLFNYTYKLDCESILRFGTSANQFNEVFGSGEHPIICPTIIDGLHYITGTDVAFVALGGVKELQEKMDAMERGHKPYINIDASDEAVEIPANSTIVRVNADADNTSVKLISGSSSRVTVVKNVSSVEIKVYVSGTLDGDNEYKVIAPKAAVSFYQVAYDVWEAI